MLIRAQFHPKAQVFFTEIDTLNNRVRNIVGEGRFPYHEQWQDIRSDTHLLSRLNTTYCAARGAAQYIMDGPDPTFCWWSHIYGFDGFLCPHKHYRCQYKSNRRTHVYIRASDFEPVLKHHATANGQLSLFKTIHWVNATGTEYEMNERPWYHLATGCRTMAVPLLKQLQAQYPDCARWRVHTAWKRGRTAWAQEMTEKHARHVAGCVFDTDLDL